jgi:hypothetical protein
MTDGPKETRVGPAGLRLSQSNCAGKDLGHWRWWEKETQEEGIASFIERARQPRWGRRVRGQAGVLHRILIPDSLLIVLPGVSSAVFLSVRPSPIAVGFGSSAQLLSRGFSFRHNGEGGRWKREKVGGGRRSGKACTVDQTAGMAERASTPSSICLSDLQGRDEASCAGGRSIGRGAVLLPPGQSTKHPSLLSCRYFLTPLNT